MCVHYKSFQLKWFISTMERGDLQRSCSIPHRPVLHPSQGPLREPPHRGRLEGEGGRKEEGWEEAEGHHHPVAVQQR